MSESPTSNKTIIRAIESFLFSSRWLLIVMYFGLSLGLALYSYKFLEELFHMTIGITHLTTEMTMLALLGLVDIAMVAHLVVMITIAGYSIFIREIDPNHIANRPRFMSHITASGLKVKMGSSLIGVSSIHLLKKFIELAETHDGHATLDWNKVGMLLAIHTIFIVSTIALSYVDGPHPVNEREENSHAY